MQRVWRFAGVFARGFASGTEAGIRPEYQAGEPDDDLTPSSDGIYATEPNPSHNGAHATTPLSTQPTPKFTGMGRNARDPRVRLIQNQCLKMSMGLFNHPQHSIGSLGFIGAIPGEGKTFLASVTATALAERSRRAVTLLDCNWENPSIHRGFGVPGAPGLAEWLRGECDLSAIRHAVSPFLHVIPAGDAGNDALALSERLRVMGASALLSAPDELLIADLPAVLTTDYGVTLPQALDAILLVVRAGVTQEAYIAEANRELLEAPLQGTILNATHSDIPRWLLRML